jgi:predicted dehydrogenase
LSTERIGIIMNGVTGRMGTNQHLIRSIGAIRSEGGIVGPGDKVIVPEPVLVGRNARKLEALATRTGVLKWSTDLDAVLSDPFYSVYFDAQTTGLRYDAVKKAIAAGKHVYCEKPIAERADQAIELARLAKAKGVKNGVVQDKLWIPGIRKLRILVESGFFGRIFAVRGEFGYWVFEGPLVTPQRPSWNYRKEEGGGIILDMVSHFSYLMESLFGRVQAVAATARVHIPERVDEAGKSYRSTGEDAVYATYAIDGDIVAHWNASWCVRVRRDDLLTIQVDGTKGSAVAGLRKCWAQHYTATPKPVWNPDIDSPIDYFESWAEVPTVDACENAFKAEWELFLRHVAFGEPFRSTLLEGAKNVLLAEKTAESCERRVWVDVPPLDA